MSKFITDQIVIIDINIKKCGRIVVSDMIELQDTKQIINSVYSNTDIDVYFLCEDMCVWTAEMFKEVI